MLGAFLLPVDAHDPPAIAVVKQLYAIDSAHERLRIISVVARFVRAPNMSNVSELFGAPDDFFFEESVLGHILFHAGDETFYV